MNKPQSLLDKLQHQLPHVLFTPGKAFFWSPADKTIHFNPPALESNTGKLALLHEVGHALLEHKTYTSDAELVLLESSAWEAASQKAAEWSVPVDKDHIEDCLDTYRDWLYARSTCPTCSVNSLQTSRTQYKCINCSAVWSVSPSRFCRAYRRLQTKTKNTA